MARASATKKKSTKQMEMEFASVRKSDNVKLALILLFVISIAALLVAAKFSLQVWLNHYPIQQIKVAGNLSYVEKNAIETTLSPFMADNFFTIDLNDVKTSLEALTWIDFADAKKEWPNTLHVYLLERAPVANWGENEFLSAKGDVFFAENIKPIKALPTFLGQDEQAEIIMSRYVSMQKVLKEVGLTIATLKLADRVSWEAKMDNGLTIVIDEKDSMEKLTRFTRLYRIFTEKQKQRLSRVDLRYENGLAIKWKADHVSTDSA